MTLSVFEIGHANGNAGRVQPNSFVPPDGDWVLALGHESPNRFVKVNTLDQISWSQDADFDVTKVFRFRALVRGPSNYPAYARVGASSDTYGFDITLPGQSPVSITYIADLNGLAIAGQTGTVASIDAFDGTLVTISGLTGMGADSVGRNLDVGGAATGANDGKFVIRELIGPTSVKYENTSAVAPDGNNGSITWTERRRDDDITTIARGLIAAVNADPIAATGKHMANGALLIKPDDLDTDIVVDAGLPNSTFMKIATAARWQLILSVDGTTITTIEIEPRVTRNLFDQGTHVLFVGAPTHEIRFTLAFNSLSAQVPSGGPFEVELPGVFVDALVFDEVT